MGSSSTTEPGDSDPDPGTQEADLEEAVSILQLHTARAEAAIASQAAARAEVVSRLDGALRAAVDRARRR